MSFDLDTNEQAQISGSDFAQMCDEMKAIKQSNAELMEALEACMKIIGPPHADESECWATTDEINAAWDMGAEAITKAKGETK